MAIEGGTLKNRRCLNNWIGVTIKWYQGYPDNMAWFLAYVRDIFVGVCLNNAHRFKKKKVFGIEFIV